MLEIYQQNIDKEVRSSIVSDTLAKVKSGEIKALDLHLSIKNIESICKSISENKAYKEAVLDEAQLHGKSFDYNSSKVEQRELGTKYDYSNCGDSELIELQAKFDKASNNLKERQEFLKNIPGIGIEIINEYTGEVHKIYPPFKTSSTGVVITLK